MVPLASMRFRSLVRIGLPPAAGGVVGPLRPAWASCTPSLATPYWRQKSCTRLSAASFSSDHMPAHFGEMRPCGLTSVISHITSPAHPSAIFPRCIRCQSLAEPLLELYWHMGETTTLFGRVRPRMVIGENKTLAIGRSSFRGAEMSDDGFCFSPRCRQRNRRASPPPGRRAPRTGSIRSRRCSRAIFR